MLPLESLTRILSSPPLGFELPPTVVLNMDSSNRLNQLALSYHSIKREQVAGLNQSSKLMQFDLARSTNN